MEILPFIRPTCSKDLRIIHRSLRRRVEEENVCHHHMTEDTQYDAVLLDVEKRPLKFIQCSAWCHDCSLHRVFDHRCEFGEFPIVEHE